MANRYIAPGGSGDGSSWANAAGFMTLNQQVGLAGPGGVVNVRANDGDVYMPSASISLSAGGASGAPVTVRGVALDGNPVGRFQINGTRTPWTRPSDPEQATDVSGWNHGADLFYFQAGASHLVFEKLAVFNAQFAFLLRSPVQGVTIQDFYAWNVRNFQDVSGSVSATDIKVLRGTITGFSKKALRMRGNSNGWLFEDLVVDSGRQDRDNFAVGLEFNETAHDALVSNCEFKNCHDTLNAYRNGDGISSELGNYDIVIEDTKSHGHTDGGFDHKGAVTLLRTECYDNKVNYRSWSNPQAYNQIKSGATRQRGGTGMRAHVGLYETAGKAADLTISGMQIVEPGVPETGSDLAIFWRWGAGSKLNATGVSVSKQASTPLVKDSGGGPTLVIEQGAAPPPAPVGNYTIGWRSAFASGVIPTSTQVDTVVADLASGVGLKVASITAPAPVPPPPPPPAPVPVPPPAPLPPTSSAWVLSGGGDGVTFEKKESGTDSFGAWTDIRVYGSVGVNRTLKLTFETKDVSANENWKGRVGQRLMGGSTYPMVISHFVRSLKADGSGSVSGMNDVQGSGTSAPAYSEKTISVGDAVKVQHGYGYELPAGRTCEIVLRIYGAELSKV